jgi:hypothetical protein
MSITRTYTAALCLVSLVITTLPVRHCNAEDTAKEPLNLVAIGTRYGTNADSGTSNDRNGTVDRFDVFGSWRTPYAWELTPGWDLGARLNASVGVIRSQGEIGAIGTFVPTLAIGDIGNVFSFELGVGAALFSKWKYGTVEDFGGPLQFIVDAGVNFRVYKQFGLGYRFQHFSDADIYGAKRGVDMHMLEFSYRY